jgi:folylpolyglutamate synthase/dihydropteroate synthase
VREHDDAPTASESLTELEEQVVFSEWRALRRNTTRSLARMLDLMGQLDYSTEHLTHRTIGVVGSKGKGTATAYAAATAASRGVPVISVMSPGVLSNADRIRMDGVTVGEDLRRSALMEIQQARQQLPAATEDSGYLAPTGLFLLMGFLIACEVGAELVVAEAGIGGASDDLSHWPLDGVIVTSIFGEHLDLLGPTVEDVAQDKTAVITDRTQWVISCPQTPEVQSIVDQQCRQHRARLVTPARITDPGLHRVVGHLPAGFARENAAAGVLAGLAAAGHDLTRSAEDVAQLAAVTRSVRYPGRLSVHDVPPGSSAAGESPRRCVVDSAVSRSGLRAALVCAADALGGAQQVLVCLPPSKDLPGFVSELEGFPGRKVFVELPGAYTGTPERSEWPVGPEWEWVALQDLGNQGVHEAAASEQLLQLLRDANSLAVGTVLFTSLVLRSLGEDAERLFTPAG